MAARTLQGFGAAILAPATLTILTTTFAEGQARARALGVWSAVASAGASAGALLGGILTDFLTWRWILFVNVPVGVVALLAARRYLPESRADLLHRHLDVAGAVTVTGGLVALVYAIVRTESYSWGSPGGPASPRGGRCAPRILCGDPDAVLSCAHSCRCASSVPGRWWVATR